MRRRKNFCLTRPAIALVAIFTVAPLGAVSQESRGDPLPEHVWTLLESRQYSAALPLVSGLAQEGNHDAEFILANFYVCGRVVEFDCSRALSLFVAATEPSQNPQSDEIVRRSKNEVAWINSTCEQPGFVRDLELALKYAEEAAKGGDPYSVDSLAAALARRGDFSGAVQAQQRAIDGLTTYAKHEPVEPKTATQFRSRLELYKAKEPARTGRWNADANCNALP